LADSFDKIAAEIEGSTAFNGEVIEPPCEVHSVMPIMVFSDIHARRHSAKWLIQGMRAAKKFKARTLIVNGDFINADSIGKYVGGHYRRHEILEDDFKAGEILLNTFAKHFQKVVFLSGNHDTDRLMKSLRGEVMAQRFWKMFGDHKNVVVTERSWVRANGVIVGHPRSYSRIRGNLAQKISNKFHASVLIGHEHHSALSVSNDGKFQSGSVGCMAELHDFEYTNFALNDMPDPMNGFATIFGDRIAVFDKFTPWTEWGLPKL
jgi:predicted phosphodiesterase